MGSEPAASLSVITSYSIHYTKLYDLADYLASRGLVCELHQSELGTSLWLRGEPQRGEAEAEGARFLREPWHPRYAEASWRTGKADEHIDYGAGSPSLLTQFLLQAGPLTLVVLSYNFV